MALYIYIKISGILNLLDKFWPGSLSGIFVEILVISKLVYQLFLELKYKSTKQFKILSDIVAYDLPGKLYRFGLVYVFLSSLYNFRLKLITRLNEKSPKIPTCSNLYSGGIWLEREVWDFFGVYFLGNLDLRRLLTDYGFTGFPLRKDFPLIGFFDIFYNDISSKINKSFIVLNQNYKNYQNIIN